MSDSNTKTDAPAQSKPATDAKPAAQAKPAEPAPASPPPPKTDPKQARVTAQWKNASPLVACRFDPTGRYVFTASEDRGVQRWNLADGKKIDLPVTHDSWVRDFAFTPDGQTMITAGYDGRLVWWPVAADKPTPQHTVEAHAGWARAVAVSPDGKLLVSGGNDNLVKLWNTADATPVRQMVGHDSHVYSVIFDPTGKFVLSGDLQGHVHQWETETAKQVRTIDAGELHKYDTGFRAHYGGVRSMAFSPDGKTLACAGLHKCTNAFAGVNQPLVMLFDFESAKPTRSLVAELKGVIWHVAIHPEGYVVGVSGGGDGGFLLFWKTDQDKEFHRFKLPNTAREADLHPDTLQLATAHADNHLRLTTLAPKKA